MSITPGPWHAQKFDGHVFDASDRLIANCMGHYDGHDNTRQTNIANARLIAAAPELYTALVLAQRWLANCVPIGDLDGPKPLPIIATVLAKVDGCEE